MPRRLSDDDVLRIRDAVTPDAEPEAPKWLEQATHRSLRVQTVAGDSIEGILTLAAEDGLLLWNARMIVQGKPVKLDGEVFIPKDQVRVVQTLRM